MNYRFQPGAGVYPAAYSFASGPNAESSTVTTPYYRRSFSDRWRESGAWITAPGATGVNVLDRNEAQFAPDFCGRTTLTFARGEGAFLVNRTGPVRAIRSVVGANSGPMSERQQVFYDRRTDETTYLRVHPIPGIMSFWDYSAAASGMRYANNNNPAGVIVDGQPRRRRGRARCGWESVDGRPGRRHPRLLVGLDAVAERASPPSTATTPPPPPARATPTAPSTAPAART